MRRINEIDYIRTFSMLAVIAIHVTSGFIHSESSFTLLGMNMAFWLNQLSRFSVPAFVLLSGLGLSLSNTDTTYISFIKRRMVKVFMPYVIWCFVYTIYNCDYDLNALWDGGRFFENFIRSLVTGDPASHLYFMVIITQMYLLYPFIKNISRKRAGLTLVLSALISLYFITGIYLRGFGVEILPVYIRQEAWLIFPTWLVYFVIGASLDRPRLEKIIDSARKYVGLSFLVFSVLIVLSVLEGRLLNTYELSIKPQLLIIVPVFCYLCMGLGKVFGNISMADKVMAFLAKHAMNIYFAHVLVLMNLRKEEFLTKGMRGMFLTYVLVFGISLIISIVLESVGKVIKKMVK
ncbi:MAG: acyltransferase [Clostridiales bacterium]|jgi:surface polysaccharide O-acyltransferase-like enzyme|nr:acyltransferase [Clostridiales bacterium]